MWTEVDLFRECAVNHSDIAPNQALGEHTYAAVWSALRAWLVGLFSRCRGGIFPNFARIAWHRVGDQLEDGIPMLRPIFVPSDAYLRTHLLHTGSGAMRASSVAAADLEPCEEYSAMKIAIKYSCSLNKDVVFCCTRHLLHQLGETLRSGRPLSVELGVGILTGRDRSLAFRFHSHYLAHWPAAAAAASLAATRAAAARSGAERLVRSEGGRAAGGSRGGGDSTESEGHLVGAGGGSGANSSQRTDSHPERRGCFDPQPSLPSSATEQQRADPDGTGQCEPQGQGWQSPGPGEGRGPRQPAQNAAAPPPGRTRPAWGARVPPGAPSPGRRSAPGAAPCSPPPHGSAGAAYDAVPHRRATSPGSGQYRVTTGQRAAQPQQHLSHEASEGMPYSPRHTGGSPAVMDAVTPVGRALHLAVRTPRQRCASPAPRGAPALHRPHGRTASSDGGACTVGVGPRSASAPRCRPAAAAQSSGGPGTGASNGAVEAAPGQRAQPASPRLESCGASSPGGPRPPWGSSHGARGRAISGGGEAARPGSSPRLRAAGLETATLVSAATSEGAPGPLSSATGEEGERLHQAPRPAPLLAAAGGGGSGVDVQQLWSPDSKLATAGGAAGHRGLGAGAGAGSARRLFGCGNSGAPSQVRTGAHVGQHHRHHHHHHHHQQQQQPVRSLAQRQLARQQQQQPPAAVMGPQHFDHGVRELDKPEASDQGKDPQQQQQHQHREQRHDAKEVDQQCRRQARKPLVLTPQKGAARSAAAAATAAPGGRPEGRTPLKQAPEGGTGELWAVGDGGAGDEPPDHSPQLRRDQSTKQQQRQTVQRSPIPRRQLAPAAAAAAPHPQRLLVRALSPRADSQQYNMRYGTPTRVGERAAEEEGLHVGADGAAGERRAVRCEKGADAFGQAGLATAEVVPGGHDNARLPAGVAAAARLNPTNNTIIAATAVAAATWDCDAPLTAGARQAEAGGLPPGAASRQGRGDGNGRLLPACRGGIPLAAGAREGATAAGWGRPAFAADGSGGGCGSESSASHRRSLVLVGRIRGEEGPRADSGGGGAPSALVGPWYGNSGGVSVSGDGAASEDLSRSCCAVRYGSADSAHLGFPLPLYDSSIDGDRLSGGSSDSARDTATDVGGGATCAATVRAVLGLQHRPQDHAPPPPPLQQQPQPRVQVVDLNRNISPHRDDRHCDAFPVPMIITEDDLPQPAWAAGPAQQQRQRHAVQQHSQPQGRAPSAVQRGSSAYAREVSDECGAAGWRSELRRLLSGSNASAVASKMPNETEREEEGEEGAQAGLHPLDCSAASSAEICWSARSARQGCGGADVGSFAQDAARAAAAKYRRACGGAAGLGDNAGGLGSIVRFSSGDAGDGRRPSFDGGSDSGGRAEAIRFGSSGDGCGLAGAHDGGTSRVDQLGGCRGDGGCSLSSSIPSRAGSDADSDPGSVEQHWRRYKLAAVKSHAQAGDDGRNGAQVPHGGGGGGHMRAGGSADLAAAGRSSVGSMALFGSLSGEGEGDGLYGSDARCDEYDNEVQPDARPRRHHDQDHVSARRRSPSAAPWAP